MFGIARTIPSPSWSVCRYPSSTNLHTLSHALTPMQLPQNRAPKATITDLVGSARRPRSFTIALACFPGSLPLLRQFAHDVLLGFEATKQQKKTTLADLLIARPQYFEVQLLTLNPISGASLYPCYDPRPSMSLLALLYLGPAEAVAFRRDKTVVPLTVHRTFLDVRPWAPLRAVASPCTYLSW